MRLLFGIILTLILVLASTASALAATPEDIYNDYADNGRLDGTYTDVELQAYLDDALIHQYGDDSILDPLDRLVKDMLSGTRSTFPFTGSVLAIAAALSLASICGGDRSPPRYDRLGRHGRDHSGTTQTSL